MRQVAPRPGSEGVERAQASGQSGLTEPLLLGGCHEHRKASARDRDHRSGYGRPVATTAPVMAGGNYCAPDPSAANQSSVGEPAAGRRRRRPPRLLPRLPPGGGRAADAQASDAVRTRDAYTLGVDLGRIGPYRRPIAPRAGQAPREDWWAGAESNCHSRRRGFYSSRRSVRRRSPSPFPRTNRPIVLVRRSPAFAPIATGVAAR